MAKAKEQPQAKPKLALYWASSCGGCEIAVLAIQEKILDVAAAFEIVLWPCVMDFKKKDIEAMADGEIDVCLFNGAIRTEENEEWAHLLRRKSKVMVAYGSCAMEGGIPGLANFADRKQMMQFIYHDAPSVDNPEGVDPQTVTLIEDVELTLPEYWTTVRTLDQVVPVEYYLPGCPPEAKWTEAAVNAILSGQLPPPGAVIGMDVTVCDEFDHAVLPALRDRARPGGVPPGARAVLRRDRDTGGLRRAVPAGQHGLPGLLRPQRRRGRRRRAAGLGAGLRAGCQDTGGDRFHTRYAAGPSGLLLPLQPGTLADASHPA